MFHGWMDIKSPNIREARVVRKARKKEGQFNFMVIIIDGME
jgi:hypothetical protein